MTALCDDILRHLYQLRKGEKKVAVATQVAELAERFNVTKNAMVIECGILEQGEMIEWDRTPGGTLRISAGGLKYCTSVLDLGPQ